ncbi:hypothetical protein ODJ79_23485 [Actinoplanes sp. KI2]|uniref:hypothetical protein n=1 Tax=Actinoplanes sp. KI2 TaxID=2983315 RepID=UPI0021D5C689|nr:hypothetical protein [Actinoplanes sp. KI2]MCU7726704.1 hypothetical protein [Actinoplanes sp. KI2]
MLDGGGGGGGTPWESMTLELMQQLIQNPSTDAQWKLASAWQKSADLLSEHRFQVQQYRDNLAAAWPPEKSAASAAYLDRLDQLIKNLSDTYDASVTNQAALSAATGSIYRAQLQMDKIYEEYSANKTALDAYNAKLVQQQNSATPTPSPSASGDEPPVAPGRQEALRAQAATLLSGVSTELAQAQAHIVKPVAYTEYPTFEDNKAIRDGGTYSAPALPPIIPTSVDGTTTTTRPTGTTTTFPTSTPATATPVTPTTGTPPPGIVLGGASPTLPTTAPGISPIAPINPGGGGGGPLPNPGLLPPSIGPLPGGSSPLKPAAPGVGPGGLGVPREGVLRSGGLPEGGMRAMAPGGIIGGSPGARGLGQPGTGTRRVNPVGGVIGESEGGVGSRRGVGMPAAEHPAGMYGQGAAGRRSGRRDEGENMHWDPDNPWATVEGVDPVVLPIQAQRVDPGPAIGLG